MDTYLGGLFIGAEPMSKTQYERIASRMNDQSLEEGYIVTFSIDQTAWIPKQYFEKYFILIDEDIFQGDTSLIKDQFLKQFIGSERFTVKKGNQLLLSTTLKNGVTINKTVEMNKENPSEHWQNVCRALVLNQIEDYLNFMALTGSNGMALEYIKKFGIDVN